MGRIGVLFLVVAITVSNLLIFTPDEGITAHPFAPNLVTINGEIELWNSSFYAGGSGIWNDPYIIESSDSAPVGLKVLNIANFVIIRNMSFQANTDHIALNITDVSVCKLENITINNRPHLIKVTGATELWIVNSTLSNIPTGYDYQWNSFTSPIWIGTSDEIHVMNCSLNGVSNVTWSTNYKFFHGSKIEIEDCTFDMAMIDVYSSTGKYKIGNCTLQNNSIIEHRDRNLAAGSFTAMRNHFNNSWLRVGYVNGARISDNSFEGPFSQLLIGRSYPVMSDVINNTFSRSGGIGLYGGLYVKLNYYNIIGNNFSYCNDGAITFNRANVDNVYIWKNIFYYNRNSGDEYNDPQVYVKGTTHSGYHSVFWSKERVGNYWTDWTKPDENNDGIVDDPYVVQNRSFDPSYEDITDNYPVTNIQFDIVRPVISILEPNPFEPLDQEYSRFSWESSDEGSGVAREFISTDNETWTDVTGQDWWSLRLSPGENTIHMKVIDRVGLYNWTSVTLDVIRINGPLRIIEPGDDSYHRYQNLSIRWDVSDEFPQKNQSILLDGQEMELGIEERDKEIFLAEGTHQIGISIWDTKDLEIDREITVHLDLTPPIVDIISPLPNITYSNELMHFKWNVTDNFPMYSIRYRIDDLEWQNIIGDGTGEIDELMGKGDHSFQVEAIDLAGWTTLEMIEFTIGDTDLLKITDPENGTITSKDWITINWVFSGDMPLQGCTFLERENTINVTGQTYFTYEISKEGTYEFKIRCVDEHGNFFQDSVIVIKDVTKPTLRILNKTQYVNMDPMIVRWFCDDQNGINSLSIRLDFGEWEDTLNMGQWLFVDLSEGEHTIEMKCADNAGNILEDEYSFIYDLTSPNLKINGPENNSLMRNAVQIISWEVDDDNPLMTQILVINGVNRDVGPTVNQKQYDFLEGENEIEVIAIDVAGNSGSITTVFFIDMEKPTITWSLPSELLTNISDIHLKWNATDHYGIESLYLLVDEERTEIESHIESYDVDLSEGSHTIELHVIDLVGLENGLGCFVVVDLSNPIIVDFNISKIEDRFIVQWKAFDNISGVEKVTIRYGEMYKESGLSIGEKVFEFLPDQWSITIIVTDSAGNSLHIEKEIPQNTGSNNGKEKKGPVLIVLTIVLLILVGFCSGIFIFLRYRKKQEDVRNEGSSDRERTI